jgi:hypothetical protein
VCNLHTTASFFTEFALTSPHRLAPRPRTIVDICTNLAIKKPYLAAKSRETQPFNAWHKNGIEKQT